MTWNHRLFKRRIKHLADKSTETFYSIREVYYNSKHMPDGYTAEDISPGGNTVDELREELVMMLKATYNPVFKSSECRKKK